jgi:uncharacterized protein involved in exopolysaccharide biosynthesis
MQPFEPMTSHYAERSAVSPASSNVLEAEPMEMPSKRSLHPRNLLHVVFKRKWMVLIVFLVCSVGSVSLLLLIFSEPLYLANAQLLISPAREQMSESRSVGDVPPWLGFNAVEQAAWTIEMLKGRFLAERVVQAIGPEVLYPSPPKKNWDVRGAVLNVWPAKLSPDNEILHEQAIERFLKNVDAKSVGRSSIVQLSFRHEDPELAARVVSLLSEMYLERHLGVQRNAETDAFFQEQFVVLKNKLAESHEKIRAFKQLHSLTGSVEEEKNLAIQQRVNLAKGLNDTRSEQPQVQSRVAELRRQLASTARTPGKIEQLRENLTTLEIQESSFALRMTAQHPTLLNVRKEIRALQEKLKALEPENLYGTSTREGLHASLEAELLRNEAEAKALRARESAQAVKLAEYQMRLDALERVQPEFIRLQNELEVDEQNYRLYLTKFEESRIARAMDAQKITSVRVIEQAHPPKSAIDSKRNSKMVLAIVGSAAAAIALAFVMHLVDRSLDTTDDVEKVLDLPVLAAIPEIRFRLMSPDRLRPSHAGAGVRAGIEAEA